MSTGINLLQTIHGWPLRLIFLWLWSYGSYLCFTSVFPPPIICTLMLIFSLHPLFLTIWMWIIVCSYCLSTWFITYSILMKSFHLISVLQKLVVKPDQLIKRRGKLGLIKAGVDLTGVKNWLENKLGIEFKVSDNCLWVRVITGYFYIVIKLTHWSGLGIVFFFT